MNHQYFFRCFDCGTRAFLIRGSCEWCEPELHRQYHEQLAAYRSAQDEFKRETGHDVLAHWDAFEAWCAQ